MGRTGELWARASKRIGGREVRGSGKPAWFKASLAALLVLCLDVATKAYVSGAYAIGEKEELLSFLSVFRVHNPGISLGVFEQLGLIDNGIRFPVLLLGASLVLVAWGMLRLAAYKPLLWLPVGIAIGGALGNIGELLYHGYATDFVYFHGLPGPANLADLFIFSGIVLFFVIELTVPRRRPVAVGPPVLANPSTPSD